MENKEIYGRIYIIKNSVNNKCYVGQTVLTVKERFQYHYDDSKLLKPRTVIGKAIKKYGKEKFKIQEIAIAYTQEQLTFSEGFYIHSFNTLAPNGYNITDIINGKGKLSEETKEKLRIKANTPERLEQSFKNGIKNRGKSYRANITSKFIGVSIHGKNYRAIITYLKKSIHLGYYNIESDAAKAYDIAAIKYFGNDAILNFPELIDDYTQKNIYIEKQRKSGIGKSGEKHISFNNPSNTWTFKWFSKILNRKTTKRFKTLEEAMKFRKDKVLDQDYLELFIN